MKGVEITRGQTQINLLAQCTSEGVETCSTQKTGKNTYEYEWLDTIIVLLLQTAQNTSKIFRSCIT